MPNYVKTVIKFKSLTQDEMVDLVNSITRRDPDNIINHILDFNKIIPEPETIEDCPEEYRIEGERTWDNDLPGEAVV